MEGKEWSSMVVNRKPTGTIKSMPVGLALGWAVSMGLTLGACGILTWIILSGKAGWDIVGYGAMVTLLAASYAGAAISCRLIRHRKLMVCGLSGAVYLFSLAAITALLFGGDFGTAWLTALLVAGGAATAALVHCAEKKSEGRGRKKRRL